MSPKKITDSDKLEIVNLYRQSGETTSSIAMRYGVSNSTISRLLKSSIPEDEYEVLIQQRRGQKGGSDEDEVEIDRADSQPTLAPTVPEEEEIHYGQTQGVPLGKRRKSSAATTAPTIIHTELSPEVRVEAARMEVPPAPIPPQPPSQDDDYPEANIRRVRRRSSARSDADDALQPTLRDRIPPVVDSSPPLDLSTPTHPALTGWEGSVPNTGDYLSTSHHSPVAGAGIHPVSTSEIDISLEEVEEDEEEDVSVLAAMFGEEVGDLEDEDEEEDEDEDEDENGDWDESSKTPANSNQFLNRNSLQVQVLPLSQAILPRTCYVVIDKFAELIVRPLKDFADLGQIPGAEVQQRTLPVFDNHRVAKRFSNNRTQRVIKVPDSRIFHKTTHHLRSKGITRLLVDGQIYSLN